MVTRAFGSSNLDKIPTEDSVFRYTYKNYKLNNNWPKDLTINQQKMKSLFQKEEKRA
jgi:hypothetical protein